VLLDWYCLQPIVLGIILIHAPVCPLPPRLYLTWAKRFGGYLPSQIQFLFEFELFHSYTHLLLDMDPYEVLTTSGGFRVSLMTIGLPPYIQKVCNYCFIFYWTHYLCPVLFSEFDPNLL
jgi:hypothetical protein